jgi:hypothetical protein
MPDMPFLDSFDHYLSADMYQKWTNVAGMTISAGNGRRGTNGAAVQGLGGYKTFTSEWGTLYVGAAVNNPGVAIFHMYNQISLIGLSLGTVGDGRLSVTVTDPTGGSPPVFASTFVLAGGYHYMELSGAVTGSGVTFVANVNEQQVISGSWAWTNPSLLTSHVAWATVQIEGQGGGATTYIDDVYVNANGFYGDVNIDVIRPNGPNTSEWIPNPNVANWNNVKDIDPDYDVTTVSSANVNDLDLYTMETVPGTANIKAIQGVGSVKKDTAGLAALKLQYGSGMSAVFSDEYYPSELVYLMVRDGRTDITNPTVINSLLFGQIRTK